VGAASADFTISDLNYHSTAARVGQSQARLRQLNLSASPRPLHTAALAPLSTLKASQAPLPVQLPAASPLHSTQYQTTPTPRRLTLLLKSVTHSLPERIPLLSCHSLPNPLPYSTTFLRHRRETARTHEPALHPAISHSCTDNPGSSEHPPLYVLPFALWHSHHWWLVSIYLVTILPTASVRQTDTTDYSSLTCWSCLQISSSANID
jgi:hypothetical protein